MSFIEHYFERRFRVIEHYFVQVILRFDPIVLPCKLFSLPYPKGPLMFIQVSLGRNVDGTPISDERWTGFIQVTKTLLEYATGDEAVDVEIDAFNGLTEDAAMLSARADDDDAVSVFGRMHDALARLRDIHGDAYIGITVCADVR